MVLRKVLGLVLGMTVCGWALAALATPVSAASPVAWQLYGAAVFTQAKSENRWILLDMVAVWCHWCHVMDDKTYANPAVAAEIQAHFARPPPCTSCVIWRVQRWWPRGYRMRGCCCMTRSGRSYRALSLMRRHPDKGGQSASVASMLG